MESIAIAIIICITIFLMLCIIIRYVVPDFCKHEWKIVDKTVLPSALEQMAKAGGTSKIQGRGMVTKKVVVILQCETCGKLDKTIESCPHGD